MNPDQLRMNPDAVRFVKAFFDQGKPVAAICHGPWMLVETGAVKGRTLTSWPSLKTDIQNAGGTWVEEEVTVSNGVVTSRKPDDIPAFNREMIALFSKGVTGGAKPVQKVA
jgi:protease I